MLLNEITCNLFYTSDQSAAGVKETKVGTQIITEIKVKVSLLNMLTCRTHLSSAIDIYEP